MLINILAIIGTFTTLAGVVGLVYCAVKAAKLKNKGLSEDEFIEQMQKLITVKMTAFCVAVFGLMLLIFAVILG